MRQKLHRQLLLRCSFSCHGLPANTAEFEPVVSLTITTRQRFKFECAHSLAVPIAIHVTNCDAALSAMKGTLGQDRTGDLQRVGLTS